MDAGVASALKKSFILFAFEAFFFEVENELCRDEKTKNHTGTRKKNEKLVLDR